MPLKKTTFSFFLDPEETVRLRAHFTTERGKILKFGVQLELAMGEEIQPLIRIDNAHGYVHQHTFYPDGKVEERRLKFTSDSDAYTYTYRMLKSSWRNFKNRYESGENDYE